MIGLIASIEMEPDLGLLNSKGEYWRTVQN